MLFVTNVKEIREINIFAVVLVVQSLPFIAAVGLAVIERTRLNDFAVLAQPRGSLRRIAADHAAERDDGGSRRAPPRRPKPGELVQ